MWSSGSWIVDGEAAGMLVRESDSMVTDFFSRVAPHVISDGLAPSEAQVAQWLAERVGPDAALLGLAHDAVGDRPARAEEEDPGIVSKPSLGLSVSREPRMVRVPLRSLETKKIAPPPSRAWLPVIVESSSTRWMALPSM